MEITGFGKMVRVAMLATTLAAALVAGGAAPARAAFVCTQFISETTIKDSLTVPAGVTCDLRNVVVRGSVTVEQGATFSAFDTEIRGSFAATGHAELDLRDVVIRGNVTAIDGGSASFLSVQARADMVVSGNVGFANQVVGADVQGSLTFSDNTQTDDSSFQIRGNVVRINLICEGNSPEPQVSFNTVGGVATGQCAGS